MKTENGKKIAEIGDRIYSRGIITTIKEIVELSHKSEMLRVVYWDRKGSIRVWDQKIDGGYILNDEPVPQKVYNNVSKYLSENLPQYTLLSVHRASEHPEDHYLYMVFARHNASKEFAAWTSWNNATQSLNHGHYGMTEIQELLDLYLESKHVMKGIIGD